jgi:hypothetical protein
MFICREHSVTEDNAHWHRKLFILNDEEQVPPAELGEAVVTWESVRFSEAERGDAWDQCKKQACELFFGAAPDVHDIFVINGFRGLLT